MFDILRANGMGPLEVSGLVLFVVLFIWISGAFWTAVAGFVVRLIGHDPAALHPDADPLRPLQGRTAVVMPIYNEDTARVFAGLDAIWSRWPRCRRPIASTSSCSRIRAGPKSRVWRSRPGTTWWSAAAPAAGCSTGGAARTAAASPATSLNSCATGAAPTTICWCWMPTASCPAVRSCHLAQMMDAHPQVGILQALPLLAGRETLFARLLQFAVRLNGPMFATGLDLLAAR
jgi:membrane glycosyltransferase